jgi:cytochrome P450
LTTLRWAVLFMMQNESVQDRARQEIASVTGASRKPARGDCGAMPYTNAVVQEIQRLANIVPINLQRIAHQETTISGFRLEKGAIAIPQISAPMLDPSIFPEPEKFDPMRFPDSVP